MATIMCAQPLWRALLDPDAKRSRRRAAAAHEPVFQNVIFGPWAATLTHCDGHDFVVALDGAAFLTVVFALSSRARFRRDFAVALEAALTDLGAPPGVIALETSVIESLPIVMLKDAMLSRTLSDVRFVCEIELGYHDDLHRVQRNLNELPHAGRDPCVPAEAVAALVGRMTSEWDLPLH